MRIHTYEKLWLVASMILIVVFVVTITFGSVGLGITMIGDEEPTIDPNEISDDERFGEPRVEQVGENEYEVYVVALTFVFQPDPIVVPANSEVTFYLTSRDVIHGFSVPGTNINSMVIPGEIAELTVEFDEPDQYGIVCHEYCGEFHHTMEGTLIVTPEDEFDQTALSVDAPDAVESGAAAELTATVENDLLEAHETTVTFQIGSEQIRRNVTVEGDGSENVSVTVEGDELEDGEQEWSVKVDGEEETGTITVGDEDDTEDGGGGG